MALSGFGALGPDYVPDIADVSTSTLAFTHRRPFNVVSDWCCNCSCAGNTRLQQLRAAGSIRCLEPAAVIVAVPEPLTLQLTVFAAGIGFTGRHFTKTSLEPETTISIRR